MNNDKLDVPEYIGEFQKLSGSSDAASSSESSASSESSVTEPEPGTAEPGAEPGANVRLGKRRHYAA